MVASVKHIHARPVAQVRALQVLGAGMLAGLLGGIASHRLWVGICFAAFGVLVTLSAIDYRCATHPPERRQDGEPLPRPR